MGRQWLVRTCRAAGILALVAVAATACSNGSSPASTGGASGHQSQPVSLTAATRNPCLLVPLSDARTILGADATSKGTSGSTGGECGYQAPSTNSLVFLSVQTQQYAKELAVISKMAPVAGVGHDAECGAAGSGSSAYAFASTIDSGHVLFILTPSCAIAGKFAQVAYTRLG